MTIVTNPTWKEHAKELGDDIQRQIEDWFDDTTPPPNRDRKTDKRPPLKNRERRNKERREQPKDPKKKRERQRDLERGKEETGRGGRDNGVGI